MSARATQQTSPTSVSSASYTSDPQNISSSHLRRSSTGSSNSADKSNKSLDKVTISGKKALKWIASTLKIQNNGDAHKHAMTPPPGNAKKEFWARKSNYHNNKSDSSFAGGTNNNNNNNDKNAPISPQHSNNNEGKNSIPNPTKPLRSVSQSDNDLSTHLAAKFNQANTTHSLSLDDMIALNNHNQVHMNAKGITLPESKSSSDTPTEEQNPPNNSSNSVKRSAFIERILSEETIDMDSLRAFSWNGCPLAYRSTVWKLLLNYYPLNNNRRAATLELRRSEYSSYVTNHYSVAEEKKTENEDEILRQIRQDVPRTGGSIQFFKQEDIQLSLERVLYIFSIRHPASGYVQGINDLATTFYYVYLRDFCGEDQRVDIISSPKTHVILPKEELFALETDVYWSLSNLLDNIQENYTFAQPGIQKLIYSLQDLIQRLDKELDKHFQAINLQYIHFAFRWINCLLMRELNLVLIVRLWTTLLSEETNLNNGGFKQLLVYVCAALLMKFSEKLKTMEFQDLVVFLQKLPTENWTERDIEMLLAQAYLYKSWFHKSQHLQ
jgi:hypothetical protein